MARGGNCCRTVLTEFPRMQICNNVLLKTPRGAVCTPANQRARSLWFSLLLFAGFAALLSNCSCDEGGIVGKNPADTTSHELTFTVDTLCEYGELIDVCVVDDSTALAIGQFHTNVTDKFDSLGEWVRPYNMARWNGGKWSLLRANDTIKVPGLYTPGLFAIWASSASDVWVASGDPMHWDGIRWSFYLAKDGLPTGLNITTICGHAPDNIIFAADDGWILRWNGTSFETMQTLRRGQFMDSWSAGDTTYLLQGNGSGFSVTMLSTKRGPGNLRELFDTMSVENVGSIYSPGRGDILVAGSQGLFRRSGSGWSLVNSGSYLYAVRGTAGNDLFVAGGLSQLMHFNGMSWHYYYKSPAMTEEWDLAHLSISKHLLIAGGSYPGDFRGLPVVLLGKR